MIGCYITGILPRSEELIKVTRSYIRGKTGNRELNKAFKNATSKLIEAQLAAEFSYISDGMLKWHDLLRPFTSNLQGATVGSLSRWFDNNTFYRKPIIVSDLLREHAVTHNFIFSKLFHH